MGEVVKYEVDGKEIALSRDYVRQYLVRGQKDVRDEEVELFIQLCRYRRLNPFLNDVYLIKYDPARPATVVVSKDYFIKNATSHPRYRGHQAGILVLEKGGKISKRNGTFYLPEEKVVGGWATVYVDGREPLEHSVSLHEYDRRQSTWQAMPATMVRKVALVQALREAFPELFQGLYDESEMPTSRVEVVEEKEPVSLHQEDEIDFSPSEIPAQEVEEEKHVDLHPEVARVIGHADPDSVPGSRVRQRLIAEARKRKEVYEEISGKNSEEARTMIIEWMTERFGTPNFNRLSYSDWSDLFVMLDSLIEAERVEKGEQGSLTGEEV